MDHMDVRLLLPLIDPPAADYQLALERARDRALVSGGEAARHFTLFADRVRDLTGDELDELYRESFSDADRATLTQASRTLAAGLAGGAAQALPAFERILPSLTAARNPFSPLFKAVCCLLMAADRPTLPAGGGRPAR